MPDTRSHDTHPKKPVPKYATLSALLALDDAAGAGGPFDPGSALDGDLDAMAHELLRGLTGRPEDRGDER